MDVCEQKSSTTKYSDLLPQSVVYKQWHYIGSLYFSLKLPNNGLWCSLQQFVSHLGNQPSYSIQGKRFPY